MYLGTTTEKQVEDSVDTKQEISQGQRVIKRPIIVWRDCKKMLVGYLQYS